jgi:DNA replication protein DnaC
MEGMLKQEKGNSQDFQQMLANGKPKMTEKEKFEVEKTLSDFEKEEREFRLREVNTAIVENIGIHYLRNFDEKKIRLKNELDERIDEMLKAKKGLILFGDVGVGKTMDLVYIFRRICEHNQKIPISYYFMPELFKRLHQGEEIKLKEFVMLDDWGREYAEPFALSQFESLIEKIYSKEKVLIITTNLTKEQFINRDGWRRVVDRVREMCSILEIPGDSMRHK